MPFNLAEARLSTIKELQKQLKKLKGENKKLKEVKYPVTFQKTYKIQQEEIKKLKEQLEDVKEEYWEKGWHTGKCDTFDEIDETVKPLKEEIKKLKEEYESYAMSHPCEMNCKHCGLTTTEDDLGISLDCGELTCEGCFEEGKSKSLKGMGNIMLIAAGKQGAAMDALEEENKKLKEENQRMSRFLESREIKYCEKCREYNEETECFGYNGVFQDSQGEWICDDCHEN